MTAFAVNVAKSTTLADWSSLYLSPDGYGSVNGTSTPCPILDDGTVLVDGHPGRIVTTGCGDAEAFVLVGSRMYVFSEWLEGQRPLLDAFLTTVHIGS